MPPDTLTRPRTKRRAEKKAPVVWTPDDSADAWVWMVSQIRAGIRPELTRESMIEWAEKYRIIPQGLSPMPGPFSWSVSPYLEEIADNLSETSTVQETYVMKGAQVCFTVGIGENYVLYTIHKAPGPMLYVAQSQGAAERRMRKNFRPTIQQSGLGRLIFSQSRKPGSRGTGDTDELMEFAGGSLTAIGPTMGDRMRSESMQKGFFDEMDAWAQEVGSAGGKRKAEGSTLVNIMRRFDAYTNTYKVLGGSTPLEASSSLIEPLYTDGDQRQYHVPCKHCGALQPLEWERMVYDRWASVEYPDGTKGKLPAREAAKLEKADGCKVLDGEGNLIPESVHYECRECGGHWKNDDKVFFLKNERQGGRAKWIPGAEPKIPNRRSYHIPSLLSPIGFRSWESICLEASLIGGDPRKLQNFWNTVLGRTWEDRTRVPDFWKVAARKEPRDGIGYDPTKWPSGALLVVVGADTQDNRIEAEAVAFGRNWESWSLGYHVFHGDTADLLSPAWTGFQNLIDTGHDGHPVAMALIDSKGHRTQEVYTFCESYLDDRSQVMACGGESVQNDDRRLYALREVTGYAGKRADLQVGQIKRDLYAYLNRPMPEQGLVPVGYCHFPAEYDDRYFMGLMSEKPVTVRKPGQRPYTKWEPIKGRPRNEPLDCRVYAMGALYVFRHFVWQSYFKEFDEELPWSMFWDWCEVNL